MFLSFPFLYFASLESLLYFCTLIKAKNFTCFFLIIFNGGTEKIGPDQIRYYIIEYALDISENRPKDSSTRVEDDSTINGTSTADTDTREVIEKFGLVKGQYRVAILVGSILVVEKWEHQIDSNFSAGSHRVVDTKQVLGLVHVRKFWIRRHGKSSNSIKLLVMFVLVGYWLKAICYTGQSRAAHENEGEFLVLSLGLPI